MLAYPCQLALCCLTHSQSQHLGLEAGLLNLNRLCLQILSDGTVATVAGAVVAVPLLLLWNARRGGFSGYLAPADALEVLNRRNAVLIDLRSVHWGPCNASHIHIFTLLVLTRSPHSGYSHFSINVSAMLRKACAVAGDVQACACMHAALQQNVV